MTLKNKNSSKHNKNIKMKNLIRFSILLILCFFANKSFAQWTIMGINSVFNLQGKIGIGTQSPDGKLDIRSNAGRSVYTESSGKTISEAAIYARSKNAGIAMYGEGYDAYGVYGFSWKSHGIVGNFINNNKNYAGYFMGPVFSTSSFVVSDRKLKSNIKPLNNALQYIEYLNPKTYLFNIEKYPELNLPEGQHFGLLADELEDVFPSLVRQNESLEVLENSEKLEFKVVNYQELVPVLIKGIQEQQILIENLNSRIEKLEALISSTANPQFQDADLVVSPNPAKNTISVSSKTGKNISRGTLQITTLTGIMIKSFEINDTVSSKDIDLTGFLPGSYFINFIYADQSNSTGKFVVVK